MKKYGCIGEKLGHSFSPELHRALGGYDYALWELTPEAVDEFMRRADFDAINVTIPYKQTVIPYLSYISDEAKSIGAVNTVVKRDGKLYGYNTDFFGMKTMLEKNGICLADKKVLIAGSGGTSKTALAVAKAMGCRAVYRVSRSAKEDCIDYEMAYAQHTDAEILINTTPLGMYPKFAGCAFAVEKFQRLEAAVDAVYNPLRTEFLQRAAAMGAKTVSGLYMLVAQAARAVEHFTDTELSADKIDTVFSEVRRRKQNIVLIGMPSCGKSTVGKKLRSYFERELIDTDMLIKQRAGISIPEIFARYGEAEFRKIESEIIEELSGENGKIISTGGGAILKPENVAALRRNGQLYFLDRPLDKLCATGDRPLSSDIEALRKRFEERFDKYLAAADCRIVADGGIRAVRDAVIKEFMK